MRCGDVRYTYCEVLLGDLHVPRAHPAPSYLPRFSIFSIPLGYLRVYISTKFCMVEIRDTTSCRQQYYSLYLEIGHTIGLASDASPCLSNPVRRFHFYSCTPPTSSLEHCVQSQFMNENHRKHLRHTIELTAKFEGMAGNDFFLYYSLNLAVNSAYSPNIHLCASASRPSSILFFETILQVVGTNTKSIFTCLESICGLKGGQIKE